MREGVAARKPYDSRDHMMTLPGPITPERWQQIKRVFALVVAQRAERQELALQEACREDIDLLLCLRRMIDADRVANQQPARLEEHIAGNALPRRFRQIDVVGAGTFGSVYRAFDDDRGIQLAVKVLHARQAGALYYFKNEFRTLRQIRHPNVVTLHDGFFVEEPWFFTMDFVPGTNLLQFLDRVDYQQRDAMLRSCLLQVAEGLHAVHQEDLVHRDLKPSHVLVTREGRVALIDFGLVGNFRGDAGPVVTFAGTPEYMSPEHASGAPLTPATDWYAVGVMLYEALTGVVPFAGSLESLARKRLEEPRPAAALNPAASRDLVDLCMHLLQREPAARGSYADVVSVLKPARHVPAPDRRDPRLVGRRSEFEQLWAAYSRAEHRPVVVHLSGPSGIGKTALIREFLERVNSETPATLVFAGRCYDTASVPFPALDDLVDRLSQHLRHLRRSGVERILPTTNFAALTRMFPVLQQFRLPGDDAPPALDSAELRRRGFAALGEMLGRLAKFHRTVLVVDDLQWGDDDGCTFLRELMSSSSAPRVLLVLAYRSEDVNSPWLTTMRGRSSEDVAAETVSIPLQALSRAEAIQLAQLLLDRDRTNSQEIEEIASQSGGSPFLLHEIARWMSASPADRTLSRPFSTADVIRARISTLDGDSRTMLELVAVGGQPTTLAVLKNAEGLVNVLAARDELLRERLARSRLFAGQEELEVYHDNVRSGVIRELDPTTLQSRHRQLARALTIAAEPDAERIAIHLEHAGDLAECHRYALEAAERSCEALAFNKASRFYELALRTELGSSAERVALLRKLGDALSNAGRGAEAAQAYSAAAAQAERRQRLELTVNAAGQLLRCGYIRQGLSLLDGVMSELRLKPPRNRMLLLCRVALLRARLRVTRLVFEERASENRSDDDRLRLDTLWTAAMGTSLIDPLRSAESSARYVLLALKSGDAYRISTALAGEAALLCTTSRTPEQHEKGRALLNTASRLAGRVANPHATAFCLVMDAVAAFVQGRWKTACGQSDAAVELLRSRCVNTAWEVTIANIFAFQARLACGEWSENRRRLPELVRDAEARGDLNASLTLRVLGCAYVLDLAADQPDRALRQLRQDIAAWSYEHADFLKCNVLQGEIDVALYQDDPMRAQEQIGVRWPELLRSQVFRNPSTFAFLHFAHGRAALAMAARHGESAPQRRELIRTVEADIATLMRGPSWSRGLALLLEVGIASFGGDASEIRAMLLEAERALTLADLQPFAMAGAWRRSFYEGESEATRVRRYVRHWTEREQIARLERLLAALAPGKYERQ
jgi:eukaryotic-like serine/threonine-protein kinase